MVNKGFGSAKHPPKSARYTFVLVYAKTWLAIHFFFLSFLGLVALSHPDKLLFVA